MIVNSEETNKRVVCDDSVIVYSSDSSSTEDDASDASDAYDADDDDDTDTYQFEFEFTCQICGLNLGPHNPRQLWYAIM